MNYKPRSLAGYGRVTFNMNPYFETVFAGGFDSKVIASFMRVISSMLFLDCLHNKLIFRIKEENRKNSCIIKPFYFRAV